MGALDQCLRGDATEGAEERPVTEDAEEQAICTTCSDWRWPPWALNPNNENGFLQVLVEDEAGAQEWIEARPLDVALESATQNSEFLPVTYEWCGEAYEDIVGPDRVRRHGFAATFSEHLEETRVPILLGF